MPWRLGGGGGVFFLLAGLVVMAGGVVVGFGAADYEFAAHEVFVMELGDGAAGFVDGKHGDEGEAFGFLRVFVAYDLGVLDLAYAVEEIEEIAFRGVEGEVADVELGRVDLDDLGLAGDPGGGAGVEPAMAVVGRAPVGSG